MEVMIYEHRFVRFNYPVLSLVSVLIEKMYQTLKPVFDHISQHLEFYAVHCTFNSFLGVWKCGKTLSFMYDILCE